MKRPCRSATDTIGSHLSVAEVAGYLDGTVEQETRQVVEAHLCRCDRCLEDVLSSARILRALGYLGS